MNHNSQGTQTGLSKLISSISTLALIIILATWFHQISWAREHIPAISSNVFVNGRSTPSIDVDSVNLQVCADNLNGKTVYVQMWRDAANGYPAHTWNYSQVAYGNCISFPDMDSSGQTFANVDYYIIAALEPLGSNEAAQKRTSCYEDSNHTRLCDVVQRSDGGGGSNVFVNGRSTPSIDVDSVNLQVCADNLSGKTVYGQMWRDAANGYPAHTWNYSLPANGGCVTFSDMDGSGQTFANVNYYTVAALEPLGSNEAAQKRTSCYDASNHTRLCDLIKRESNTTCPPSNCTAGRDVNRDFFQGVVQHLNIPTSDFSVDALMAWAPYENTSACWNPLATTRAKSGSCCFNSVCVRNYLNQNMGIEATAETLALRYYQHIRAMLRLESFDREGLRGDLSTWGTCSGQRCDSLLDKWQTLWNQKVVMIETPHIHPDYKGMCLSSWYKAKNNNNLYTYQTLNTNDVAYSKNAGIWQADIPTTGLYRVEAYIAHNETTHWQCPSRSIGQNTKDAHYTIYYAGGKRTISADQTSADNSWLNLGTYVFRAGSTAKVELTDQSREPRLSHTVSFGAIRLVLVQEAEGESTQVDVTRPWGKITSPVNNPTISGDSITLKAEAEDNPGGQGVSRVYFWLRYADDAHAPSTWHSAGSDDTPPYEVNVLLPSNILRSQLIEVGIHVEDKAGNYCIDPSPAHDFTCNDLTSKETFVYKQPDVSEDWIPADLRAYLNQRSLVSEDRDNKCGAASSAMMLAMNGKINSDYDSMAAVANSLPGDSTATTYVNLLNSQYGLGVIEKTYNFFDNKDDLWGDVVRSISAHHPVMLLSKQFTLGGHYIVIVGYREQNGVREFIVYDPNGRWTGKQDVYDRNTNRLDDPNNPDSSRDSVKGRWVWYKLDDIWPDNILEFSKRKPYLIISESVLSNKGVTAPAQTPDSPPDLLSTEEEDIGTYEVLINPIYLPLVIRNW